MDNQSSRLEGVRTSVWMATADGPIHTPLPGDARTEVAVVGGGLAGLLAAFELLKRGHEVTVIEAQRIGAATSGHTTAKVTCQHGMAYAALIDQHGKERATLYAAAAQAGLARIASLVEERGIDCEFRRARSYLYATTEEDAKQLRSEMAAQQSAGLRVTWTSDTELPFPVKGAVMMEDQAHFHPRKFLLGIARAVEAMGGHIHEQTRATGLDEYGTTCVVHTERGDVNAAQVVIATQYPFQDRSIYAARVQPRRSYGLLVETDGPPIEHLYVGAGESFTVRPYLGGRPGSLIIGGEGHEMGKADAEEAYRKLEERTRERFHVTGIPYRWSDHDLQPSDRLPFIGRGTPMVRRQWVASGFGLWGMTTSAAAALLLTDLVEGKAHPWAALFDPSRASSFAPNAQMLGQAGNALKTAKARVSPSRRPTALPAPGEGAVITKGGKKVAVYHSPEGRLTAVSATCTHMGCILTWNKAETAWDCPCHGSVFATDGSIVRGPATQPLEAVDIEEGRDRRAA